MHEQKNYVGNKCIPCDFVVFFKIVCRQCPWILAEVYVGPHYLWSIADSLPIVIECAYHIFEVCFFFHSVYILNFLYGKRTSKNQCF
jgi:hypothetical protein